MINSQKTFKIGHFYLKIHFLSFISLFALFFAESGIYPLLVIFCAAFHEMGHILCMNHFHNPPIELYILPFGAQIKCLREMSYKEELLVSANGPFFSIFLCAVLYPFLLIFPSPELLFCIMCSFFLAAINLVPVRSFDGGRMVRCFCLCAMEYEKALNFIRISELLSLLLLSFICVWCLIFFSFNFSLLGILIYLFFSVYRTNY